MSAYVTPASITAFAPPVSMIAPIAATPAAAPTLIAPLADVLAAGELSEDDLENVRGGLARPWTTDGISPLAPYAS